MIAHHESRLGSDMVYIYVDQSNLPIQVHRSIILQSSDFFNNALNGAFKESSGALFPWPWPATLLLLVLMLSVGIVQLLDQKRDLVEIYVEWLYFGIINPTEIDPDAGISRFTQLYELYTMADLLQDQEFANAIMDTLIEETEALKMWPTGLAAAAWTDLPESSLMRKYIKDVWVALSYSAWFDMISKDVADAPKEFWVEVAKSHTMIREKTEKVLKPSWANRCRYHVHKDGKQCS